MLRTSAEHREPRYLVADVAARSASDPVRGRCRCAGRGRRAARVPRRGVGEPAEPHRRRRVQSTSDRGHVRAGRQRARPRAPTAAAGSRRSGTSRTAEGPKQALRIFDQRIASDPAIEASCHRIAHMIGSAALARFEGNVSQAFTAGTASCNSGYYHGILERALVGVGTKAELRAGRSPPLRRPGRARDGLHRLPVRPRARTRADDPHRARPAALALDLRTPPDRVGPDLLRRRRLHGELQLLRTASSRASSATTTPSIPATPWRRSTSSTATSR